MNLDSYLVVTRRQAELREEAARRRLADAVLRDHRRASRIAVAFGFRFASLRPAI